VPDRPVHPEAALQGIVPAGVRAGVGLAGRATQRLAPARAEGGPAALKGVPGRVVGAAFRIKGCLGCYAERAPFLFPRKHGKERGGVMLEDNLCVLGVSAVHVSFITFRQRTPRRCTLSQ